MIITPYLTSILTMFTPHTHHAREDHLLGIIHHLTLLLADRDMLDLVRGPLLEYSSILPHTPPSNIGVTPPLIGKACTVV